MNKKLSVLIVEDNEADAILSVRQLKKAGYEIYFERVETAEDLRKALNNQSWDAILVDYNLPRFDAPAALEVLHETGIDIPFIIISGAIGEDKAVEMMKAGAHDYFRKDELTRLVSAVEREIRDAASRRARRLAEQALLESNEQLKVFAAHLQTVREDERIQIARELHDNLGQNLTGLRMDISRIVKKLKEADEEGRMNDVIEQAMEMIPLIDTTIEQVKKISSELRPRVLDDLGLIPAIEWQIEEFKKRSGTECIFYTEFQKISLDKSHLAGIFRIFQETLTNIMRHANATKVNVRILKKKHSAVLEVEDNGCGLNKRKISDKKSLGILGMRERAVLFGGEVLLAGRKGKGTKVTLLIPL